MIKQGAAFPFGRAAFLFSKAVERDFSAMMSRQFPSSLAIHFKRRTGFTTEIESVPSPEEPSMREFVRHLAVALSVACLAVSMAVMSTGSAFAQAKPCRGPATGKQHRRRPI